MGKFESSVNLFHGVAEINRLIKLLDDEGYRKLLVKDSESFGLIRGVEMEGNGLVSAGSVTVPNPTIKVSELFAVDSDGLFVRYPETDNITIPANNTWYWVRASHAYSNLEEGTLAISTSGDVAGTATKFLEVLRGMPDFPAKISFPDSILNTQEYEVLDVIDNTNMTLQGVLQAETNVKYRIVGTFSPGYTVPSADKYPFNYDYCTLELVLEVIANTPPAYTAGKQFYLARIKRDGANIYIYDKRSDEWLTRSYYEAKILDQVSNPIIGVSQIRFDNALSTRTHNLVRVEWTFTSDNFTYDTNTNKVTLNAGTGGKLKATSDFVDNSFNGWRLYYADGSFDRIVTSTLIGAQINLVTDGLSTDKIDASDVLVIAPDAEEIEIQFKSKSTDATTVPDVEFVFPINKSYADCRILVYKATAAGYDVAYRYKTLANYSMSENDMPFIEIPTDSTNGYYAEDQFDADGTLIAMPTRTTYDNTTDGFIPLALNANAYTNIIAALNLGDLRGVTTTTVDATVSLLNLIVGTARQYQVIDLNNFTLTQNIWINLSKAGAVNGNEFVIHFKTGLTSFAGQTVKIVTDYVAGGGPPTQLIHDFVSVDNNYILNLDLGVPILKPYILDFIFDGVDWNIKPITEEFLSLFFCSTQGMGRSLVLLDLTASILASGNFVLPGGGTITIINSSCMVRRLTSSLCLFSFYCNFNVSIAQPLIKIDIDTIKSLNGSVFYQNNYGTCSSSTSGTGQPVGAILKGENATTLVSIDNAILGNNFLNDNFNYIFGQILLALS